jgi:hypothetical protein
VKICTEQFRKYSQVYVELPIVLFKNDFDKSVLYGTTKILMNQFKGKHKSQLA